MKKKLFLAAFGLMVLLAAEAQREGDKILFAGVGLGASVHGYDYVRGSDVGILANHPDGASAWNDVESGEAELAYNVGAMLDIFVMDKFAITFGLSYDYNPVSYKYPKRIAPNDLEINMQFAFLTVSAGTHYYFFDHLVVGGGLYLGIPVSKRFETSYDIASASDNLPLKNDIGLFLDLGYNFNIGDHHNILLSMRFKNGFTKIYTDTDIITNIKMATFYILQVAYGYKF